MITTTCSIPPLIWQYFDKLLLIYPTPKFGHDEEDIINILMYVFHKKWKKLEKCPSKKMQCEKLYQEIMRLYERIKEEKENLEATAGNLTQGPFYYFNCSTRSHTEILQRLIYKAKAFSK